MKTTVNDVKVVSLSKYTDKRGSLIPIESGKDVDLVFKRSFFVFDVPKGEKRGYHAHRTSEQVLICPFGKCTVTVKDGNDRKDIVLDTPGKAIYVPSMIWNEILYEEENCIFLALTSETYDKEEYIGNWKEFTQLKDIK